MSLVMDLIMTSFNPEPEGYDLPPTQAEYHAWETYNQPIMRPPPDTSWVTFETFPRRKPIINLPIPIIGTLKH